MYTDRSNKETSEKLKWTKKVHTEGTNKEKTVTSNIIYRIINEIPTYLDKIPIAVFPKTTVIDKILDILL